MPLREAFRKHRALWKPAACVSKDCCSLRGQSPLEEGLLRGLAPRTCLGHYTSTIATFSCRISPTALERGFSLAEGKARGNHSSSLKSPEHADNRAHAAQPSEKDWEPLLKSSLKPRESRSLSRGQVQPTHSQHVSTGQKLCKNKNPFREHCRSRKDGKC